ncbi:hypothetical protein ACHAQH_000754 [Verticillium albo-atrum]
MVSHTTRPPRLGEVDGVNYHFISTKKFKALVTQDDFIEHATFSGYMYGTSRTEVAEQAAKSFAQGTVALLEVDLHGAKQMKRSVDIPAARYVFINPPNLEALENRLRRRGTENEEVVQRRIAQAKIELDYADTTPGFHDFIIVNNDIEEAYSQLETFIFRR